MTSNQVAYWANEESKRSHMAEEAERSRHNKESERIDRVKNELTARGLDIKDKELLSKMAALYAEYGEMGIRQMPTELQELLAQELGVDLNSHDAMTWLANVWQEFGNSMRDIGGGKGFASLFF